MFAGILDPDQRWQRYTRYAETYDTGWIVRSPVTPAGEQALVELAVTYQEGDPGTGSLYVIVGISTADDPEPGDDLYVASTITGELGSAPIAGGFVNFQTPRLGPGEYLWAFWPADTYGTPLGAKFQILYTPDQRRS